MFAEMANNRQFAQKHNVVVDIDALQSTTDDYREMFEYLTRSRILFVLTTNPPLYETYLRQFWDTVIQMNVGAHTVLRATVNNHQFQFSAGDLRTILQLGEISEEDGGVEFDQALLHACFQRMGYAGPIVNGQYVHPFLKWGLYGKWRYFAHILLVGLSNRRSGFDAINLNVASQLVALTLNRPYSFSQYFFEAIREQIMPKGAPFMIMPRLVMTIINHFCPDLPPGGNMLLQEKIPKRIFKDLKVYKGNARPAVTFDPPLFGHLVDPDYVANDDWELAVLVPGDGHDQPPPPPPPPPRQQPPQQPRRQPQQQQQQQRQPRQRQQQQPQQHQSPQHQQQPPQPPPQQPQPQPAAHNPDVEDNIAVVEMLAQVGQMPEAEREAFVAGALGDQPQLEPEDEFVGLRDVPMPDFDYTQGGMAGLVGTSSESEDSHADRDATESSTDEEVQLTAEQLGALKRKRTDETAQATDVDFDPHAEEDSSDSDDIPLIRRPRGKTLRIRTGEEQQAAAVSAVVTTATAVTTAVSRCLHLHLV